MNIERMLKSSLVVCHDASVLLGELVPEVYSEKQYLLKDDSVSSKPAFGREKGVFVNPYLVLDLHISKTKMTAAQAKLFCKMENRPIPTLFQTLLLQLNMQTVQKRLNDIGMGAVLTTTPLDEIWHEEALKTCRAGEARQLVTLVPRSDFQELECVCLHEQEVGPSQKLRQFLIDRTALISQEYNRFYPEGFVLLGSWNKFDLLCFTPDEDSALQWLFFRDRDTYKICHYIVNDTYEGLEFLSDELYVHSGKVYQAVNGEFIPIHLLGGDSVSFSAGRLCICRDDAYCGEMPSEYVYTYYVKGADGLFTQCDD